MPAYDSKGNARVSPPAGSSSLAGVAMEVDPAALTGPGSFLAGLDSQMKPAVATVRQEIPQLVGNFELITEETLEFADVRVAKWRSKETGLKVVWADVEGPLVQGYFSVATEIFNDSGIPHTLEHAVFMGSEQYPFKGVLDTLANRMFANGTNAWTDTTNTTYTVGTAGAEGFLGILPVFLDHVLYPTLTQAGFVTEVHNVNGKGEDAGVVYSEMQGRENGADDLMQLRLQRTLFKQGSGYRSETGGLMEALRTLRIEEIRDYHGGAYLPHNLTLIVAGRSLSPTDLLNTLQTSVEPSIVAHHQNKGPKPEGWKRPFVESTTAQSHPTIPVDLTEVVQFPEKDESTGSIYVSWLGPLQNDHLTILAIDVLGEYLTDGAVSPLYQEFVEIDDPACTDISFGASTQDPSIITAYIASVPSAILPTLDSKVKASLAKVVADGIDMKRMASTLETQRLQVLEAIETDAADTLQTVILTDALFGAEDGSDLGPSMAGMTRYSTLSTWSSDDWSALLSKYFLKAHSITTIGEPSASLADKLEKDEKDRVAATVARLGPAGLAKLTQEITDAQTENDRPIPPAIIKKFDVPDVTLIEWFEVDTARSEGVAKGAERRESEVQKHIDAEGAEVPLFIQFDQIKSSFIEISIVLFAPSSPVLLNPTLRSLLPIYLDSFFSLPVNRANGQHLSYEDVVRTLDAETLSYSINLGTYLQEGVTLKIKVVKEKYEVAIAWVNDLIWGSVFAVDRLKISATKALQDLPSEKRDGSEVAYSSYRKLVCSADSTNITMNLLNRCDFLPAFVARLKEEPDAIVAEFEAFRDAITDPKAMRIGVKGDITSLPNPSSAWLKNFKQFPTYPKSSLIPVVLGREVLSPLGTAPAKKVIVFGISSIESSFAYHVAKGPLGWEHPDQPALTVARSVLNAMEGFLWKHIRGAGLAYGANIDQDLENGFVYYRVYKSPDSYAAFEAAKGLIDQLVSGEIVIDDLTIESAKSSLAYNTAAKESTMNDAANASFVQQVLLTLPPGHGRLALAKTADITSAQIVEVIRKWIQPIFHPDTSVGSVAMGKGKMEETAEKFEALGYEVERKSFGEGEEEEGSDDGSESGSGSGSEA